jgi:putative transposase
VTTQPSPSMQAGAGRVELSGLDEVQRAEVMRRWQILRPHLHDGVPLARAAREAGVPVRTAQRWLARYRADGLVGLARAGRSDRGRRRLQADLVRLVEGLALQRPRPSTATIARRAAQAAQAHGWPVPSYSAVHAIVGDIDPHLRTLAHDGPDALRDRYELVFRRQAARPNELWQADHTELDLLVLDANGSPARPWLTVVLDDCSRAVAGYSVFLGAPSALNLSLALRQAIRRKTDPGWVVHGLPDALYVDHGSDFTSDHIAAVAADLHIRLVHSAVGRPQGRGKLERFFGSITTELLPTLPGHLMHGKPASPPRLSLPELDAALGRWITNTYHQRPHSETGQPPQQAWLADGWLPRTPDSLEALDLLLVMVAKPRVVHRDGIRFQGLRYLDPTLAAYVGEPVTIRYDPRDLGEIRVFHRNRFLCRAISSQYAGQPLTLKDIQTARTAHRRALRGQLAERRAAVAEYLPPHPATRIDHDGPLSQAAMTPTPQAPPDKTRPRLYSYLEDTR